METLAEARDYILALPPGLRQQEDWHRAADFLIMAAESGNATDIQQATFQLELTLLIRRQLAGR